MREKYPRIDEAFRQVADDIHGGYTAAEATRRIRPWLNSSIMPFHRAEVLAKLEQWARAVEDAREYRREEQMKL